jgi:4-oxalocrotonate tautomerase
MIMPIVNIDVASRLSKDQKASLVKGVTETITEVTKVPDETVIIIINEVERDNIAKAGVLFSDRT